ncbi:MAG: ABC transporter permease [Chloroflexota bacterium]|nr:ABC transporter permease [Chloroflexota bacterium]
MTRYIIRRLVHAAFIVWGVATLVFFMLQIIPGDPIILMLGEQYTPEAAEQLRNKLGLDEPIYVQYFKWVGNVLQGDLGRSNATGESVSDAIKTALPKTMSIAVVSFAIAILIAFPAGIIAALKRNSPIDYVVSILAFVGVSMPGFWFGIVLILLFAVRLGWFPAVGYTPISEGFWEWLKHLILPSIAVGMGYAAILMRFIRAGLLEVLGSDYVRTARSKGLRERAVIGRHAMRNALIPVVTVAGIQLALLLNGSVVIEIVFSIRGMGRLLVRGILDKDYPVVQASILLIAVVFVLANLIVDIIYTFLDPRIRYD